MFPTLSSSVVGSTTTQYIDSYYEVINPGASQVVKKYYYAGSTRVAMSDNGVVRYFVTDHLGSTTKLINTNGAEYSEMQYLAWGSDRLTPPGIGTSFKYTGQRQTEAGLYFYNARYYDPELGRFIQADTIIPEPGNPLAWDRYAYGYNNPVNSIDPSGHSAWVGEGGYDDEHKNQSEEDAQRNRQLYCQAGNTLYCSYAQNHPVDTAVSITVGMIGAGAAAAVLTPAGAATAGTVAAGTTTLGATTYTTVAGYGASAGTALETANIACGGDMCSDEIKAGTNTVYQVFQNGKVIYVGITKNFPQRAAYWLHKESWTIVPIQGLESNLSRLDARAVEQVLIGNLPNLVNQINSISANDPIYNYAINRGSYLLNLINYFGR